MIRTALLSLLFLLGLVACSGADGELSLSSGGMSSSSSGLSVSGGGYRVDPKMPTLFYGTVLEQGRRRFTYLVLARELELPQLELQIELSGSTQVEGGSLFSDNSLSVQEVELTARFEARTIHERAALEDPVLTLQGEVVDPAGDWFFLFDREKPDASPKPLKLEMPELPDSLEELQGFTEQWIDETVLKRPEIIEFLK